MFAPIDDAFTVVYEATMNFLAKDAELLTSALTHHVVSESTAPDSPDSPPGTPATTLAGDELEASGSGDNAEEGGASVVCGGILTDNPTIELIEQVLTTDCN